MARKGEYRTQIAKLVEPLSSLPSVHTFSSKLQSHSHRRLSPKPCSLSPPPFSFSPPSSSLHSLPHSSSFSSSPSSLHTIERERGNEREREKERVEGEGTANFDSNARKLLNFWEKQIADKKESDIKQREKEKGNSMRKG